MIHIIPTLDYEIFGNGKGDVKKHMVNPTKEITSIFDKYGVKYSIMFEYMEYKKFKEYDKQLSKDLGYSPYNLITKQLTRLSKKGHDIQLHIHPQWLNARYKDNKWVMEDPYLPIDELDYKQIVKILYEGKSFLEKFCKRYNKDYECLALRLTNQGWNPPSSKVVEAMKEIGLIAHSLSTSDKSLDRKNSYWPLDDGVFELPILSFRYPWYKKYTLRRILANIYLRLSSSKFFRSKKRKTTKEDNGNMCNLKWDFCKMNSKRLTRYLKIVKEKYDWKEKEIPLIMIGHSKDFFFKRDLDKFIANLVNDEDESVRFNTLLDFGKTYLKECEN